MKAVEFRHEYMKTLVAKEGPLVDLYFRDLCDKLKIAFNTKPVENYRGYEGFEA